MPKSSMEALKGQVAAGQYAMDAGILAGDILSKFALIRHVRRHLIDADEEARATDDGPGAQRRRQRGSAPAATRRPSRRRPKRLQ